VANDRVRGDIICQTTILLPHQYREIFLRSVQYWQLSFHRSGNQPSLFFAISARLSKRALIPDLANVSIMIFGKS
jgi:hypothetical protein